MIAEYVNKIMQFIGVGLVKRPDQGSVNLLHGNHLIPTEDDAEAIALAASLASLKLNWGHVLAIAGSDQQKEHEVINEVTIANSLPEKSILTNIERADDITPEPDCELPRQVEYCNVFASKYPPVNFSGRKPDPVPAWFGKDKIRAAMQRHVNHVVNGRWEAVSMPNGIVWFRYNALLDVIREASNRDPFVLGLAVDKLRMNNLVFSVLKALRDDCVIWNMLGKGYLGIKCDVTDRKGNITETLFLTPVRATWFNMLPSWLEREKSYKLYQMVSKIEPVKNGSRGPR